MLLKKGRGAGSTTRLKMLFFAFTGVVAGCVGTPNDPLAEQPLPWVAEGISSERFESHLAYDRARKAVYFVRSSPQFQGWRILFSKCGESGWLPPQQPQFAGDGVEADPFITSDGKEMYFISSRSENGRKQTDLDIWKVTRGRDGDWTSPVRLPEPINSPGAEWFPRITADGTLIFGSDRPGGHGATDIYSATPSRGGRWAVRNLGPTINTSGDEYEAEMSPSRSLLVVMADGDLYSSARTKAGWTERQRLGGLINTSALEVGPTFSPDGRALMFSRGSTGGRSGEFFVVGRSLQFPPKCGR